MATIQQHDKKCSLKVTDDERDVFIEVTKDMDIMLSLEEAKKFFMTGVNVVAKLTKKINKAQMKEGETA